MALKLETFNKQGDETEEYVLFRATANINLSGYAVLDKTFRKSGKASNIFRHIYFFPEKEVKAGEYVSLRTGKNEEGLLYEKGTTNVSGSVCHRFFWGSDAPIWNDANKDSLHLIKYQSQKIA